MKENDGLTIYRLLEVIVSTIAILTPLMGAIWYAETKFHHLEVRVNKIESTLLCTIRSLSNDANPQICIGEK